MFILILILFLLFPTPSHAQSTPYGQTGAWNQVFADEFNSNSVDLNKWQNGYYYGPIDTNMGNADLSNVSDDGQSLHFGASGDNSNFTVGALTTKQTFNSGYFEARMKLAKGVGVWPAFWALYDRNGTYREVDFMEYLGNHSDYYYSTLHINGTTPQGIYKDLIKNPDLSLDYHTYAGEITPTEIIFYLDGVEFWRSAQTDFNYPFGLTINQGIMCKGVLWDNNQCDSTTFSPTKETLVDWVRVWTRPTLTPIPTNTLIPSPTVTPLLTITPIPTSTLSPSPTIVPSPTTTQLVCDANLDGAVNMLDFIVWKKEYLGIITTKNSDCNHDNLINLADFALWKLHRY